MSKHYAKAPLFITISTLGARKLPPSRKMRTSNVTPINRVVHFSRALTRIKLFLAIQLDLALRENLQCYQWLKIYYCILQTKNNLYIPYRYLICTTNPHHVGLSLELLVREMHGT